MDLYTLNFFKRQTKCSLSVLHFYLRNHQKWFVGVAPPGPAGGANSAPPDSIAGLRGLILTPQLKRGTPYGNDLDLYVGRYVTATSSRRHLLVGPVAG